MKKCILQYLKSPFIDLMIMLPILLYIILLIIFKLFNFSDKIIAFLNNSTIVFVFINVILCLINIIIPEKSKNKNLFRNTMIGYFSLSAILVLFNIKVISSMFLDDPQSAILNNLIIYMLILSLVWIWFFHSCYKECMVAISKDNKGRTLFLQS